MNSRCHFVFHLFFITTAWRAAKSAASLNFLHAAPMHLHWLSEAFCDVTEGTMSHLSDGCFPPRPPRPPWDKITKARLCNDDNNWERHRSHGNSEKNKNKQLTLIPPRFSLRIFTASLALSGSGCAPILFATLLSFGSTTLLRSSIWRTSSHSLFPSMRQKADCEK